MRETIIKLSEANIANLDHLENEYKLSGAKFRQIATMS